MNVYVIRNIKFHLLINLEPCKNKLTLKKTKPDCRGKKKNVFSSNKLKEVQNKQSQ